MDVDFDALLRKQDALNSKPHDKLADPGGHNSEPAPINMKHLSKQKRLELVANQMDEQDIQDAIDKEKREKEEAEAKLNVKKKPMFPFLQKKQKSREQILFDMWCGGGANMDLFNILEFLEIKTWPERRHWFFFWLDISKLLICMYEYTAVLLMLPLSNMSVILQVVAKRAKALHFKHSLTSSTWIEAKLANGCLK